MGNSRRRCSLADGTGPVLVHATGDADVDLSDGSETTVTASGRADIPPAFSEFVQAARPENGDADPGLADSTANPL